MIIKIIECNWDIEKYRLSCCKEFGRDLWSLQHKGAAMIAPNSKYDGGKLYAKFFPY